MWKKNPKKVGNKLSSAKDRPKISFLLQGGLDDVVGSLMES